MTYGRGVQAYTQTQVSTTTNQKQLILMAYDGILRFLAQARSHMIAGDEIEDTHNNLVKARAIIEELAGTLNMEAGGDIAQSLWKLYLFFLEKITEANFTKSPKHIDDIVPAIKELREGWAGMEVPKDDLEVQALNRRIPETQQSSRLSFTG